MPFGPPGTVSDTESEYLSDVDGADIEHADDAAIDDLDDEDHFWMSAGNTRPTSTSGDKVAKELRRNDAKVGLAHASAAASSLALADLFDEPVSGEAAPSVPDAMDNTPKAATKSASRPALDYALDRRQSKVVPSHPRNARAHKRPLIVYPAAPAAPVVPAVAGTPNASVATIAPVASDALVARSNPVISAEPRTEPTPVVPRMTLRARKGPTSNTPAGPAATIPAALNTTAVPATLVDPASLEPPVPTPDAQEAADVDGLRTEPPACLNFHPDARRGAARPTTCNVENCPGCHGISAVGSHKPGKPPYCPIHDVVFGSFDAAMLHARVEHNLNTNEQLQRRKFRRITTNADGTQSETIHYACLWPLDRKSTRLNSSHSGESRMPSSA